MEEREEEKEIEGGGEGDLGGTEKKLRIYID